MLLRGADPRDVAALSQVEARSCSLLSCCSRAARAVCSKRAIAAATRRVGGEAEGDSALRRLLGGGKDEGGGSRVAGVVVGWLAGGGDGAPRTPRWLITGPDPGTYEWRGSAPVGDEGSGDGCEGGGVAGIRMRGE